MQQLLDQITNNTTLFEVVAEAPSGESLTTLDAATASAALKTLLQTAVANVYALEAPEGKTPTDAIYQLVSAKPLNIEGFRVLTQVTFVVTVRAETYPDLLTAVAAVEAEITASSGLISITDAAADIEQHTNYHLMVFELQYIVPAATGVNDFPAVLVSFDGDQAQPSQYDNTVRQRVDRTYSMVILSTTNNLATLRAELHSALLGWQETANHFEMQYRAGDAMSLPGGLYGWQAQYSDGLLVTQQ